MILNNNEISHNMIILKNKIIKFNIRINMIINNKTNKNKKCIISTMINNKSIIINILRTISMTDLFIKIILRNSNTMMIDCSHRKNNNNLIQSIHRIIINNLKIKDKLNINNNNNKTDKIIGINKKKNKASHN